MSHRPLVRLWTFCLGLLSSFAGVAFILCFCLRNVSADVSDLWEEIFPTQADPWLFLGAVALVLGAGMILGLLTTRRR